MNAKNGLAVFAGAVVAAETFLPVLLRPDVLNLCWVRLLMVLCGVLAIVALVFQARLQSKEEKEQKRLITEIHLCVQKVSSGKALEAKAESATAETATSRTASGADISAKLLRGHLVHRHPFADLTGDLMRATGHPDYRTQCDFLFEVHAVNRSENAVTVQRIIAEAEIGGRWIPLTLNKDLHDYQIEFEKELVDNPGFIGGQRPRVAELEPNLAETLDSAVMSKGIGYKGWLGFGAEISADEDLKKPIPYRITFIDALDCSHPVDTSEPLLTDGTIIHSPEVWRERFKRL